MLFFFVGLRDARFGGGVGSMGSTIVDHRNLASPHIYVYTYYITSNPNPMVLVYMVYKVMQGFYHQQ